MSEISNKKYFKNYIKKFHLVEIFAPTTEQFEKMIVGLGITDSLSFFKKTVEPKTVIPNYIKQHNPKIEEIYCAGLFETESKNLIQYVMKSSDFNLNHLKLPSIHPKDYNKRYSRVINYLSISRVYSLVYDKASDVILYGEDYQFGNLYYFSSILKKNP